MENRSFPERKFKVWDYLVSHRQMVIRSLGPTEGSPNLDLHFQGVDFVQAPTVFSGLEILKPTHLEVEEAAQMVAPKRCEASSVWVLASAGRRHLVVAESLDVGETDYPMMTTALVHPSA